MEQVLQLWQGLEPGFLSVWQLVARQPEAAGNIRSTLILGSALAEATAIYGFVVALLIIIMLGQ